MIAARRVTHAHHEVARKAEAVGALADAERHIRKMVGATTRDRTFHRESGVRIVIGTQHSNSLTAQLARVIEALRSSPRSTIELRRDFDVMMPAARVFQLRGIGFNILTQRTQEATDCGKLHSVAKYVLIGNPADEPAG